MSQFETNNQNETFDEYPLRGRDEWQWPIHETPSGSASLVEADMHRLK